MMQGQRARSNPARLRELWAENPNCHWCGTATIIVPAVKGQRHQLPLDRATLDHLYPRHIRFTMPEDSDRDATVLCCYACNQRRGSTPLERWQPVADSR